MYLIRHVDLTSAFCSAWIFRAAELESEVAELRCEVEYLRGAVERLTLRVDRVEHRPSATSVAPSRAGSALGSYSVVGENKLGCSLWCLLLLVQLVLNRVGANVRRICRKHWALDLCCLEWWPSGIQWS